VGAALLGVAGGFDAASKVPYSFWTSVPVIVAYVMFGLSLACFTCAIREVPIPYPVSRRITVQQLAVQAEAPTTERPPLPALPGPVVLPQLASVLTDALNTARSITGYDRDTCKSGNGSIFLRCSRRSTLIRCRDVPRRSETSRLPRSPDSEVNSVRDFRDSAGERPLSVGISFRDQNHDRLMAGFTRTSAAPVQARLRHLALNPARPRRRRRALRRGPKVRRSCWPGGGHLPAFRSAQHRRRLPPSRARSRQTESGVRP
jgi:hypothetical protein